MANQIPGRRVRTAAETSEELREELRDALEHPREIFGYGRYGDGVRWRQLDRLTGGLQEKNLGVLVARPKVGKSMLAAAWVPYIAEQALAEDKVVRVVTLEMRRKAYQRRMAAIMAGIKDPKNIRRGTLDTFEQRRYYRALDHLEAMPIEYLSNEADLTEAEALVPGNSSITLDEVSRFIRAKDADPTFWWVLDHIGLLSDLRQYGDVTASIYGLANSLANLAHTTATGLVIGHLNRAAVGQRVGIESIAGSDQLGKNADQIMLLQRPFMEAGELSPEEQAMLEQGEPAFLTFYSRDEGSGIDVLYWRKELAAFEEMEIDGVDVRELMPKSSKKK